MATHASIIKAVDSIAAFYQPIHIILFGSYAYGTPNDNSDVDFLVLKNFTGSDHDHYVKIRTAVNFPFAVDLLVRRPDVVQQRIEWNDFFLKEIIEKGIVLYAADNQRMGQKGRRRLRRHLAVATVPQGEPV